MTITSHVSLESQQAHRVRGLHLHAEGEKCLLVLYLLGNLVQGKILLLLCSLRVSFLSIVWERHSWSEQQRPTYYQEHAGCILGNEELPPLALLKLERMKVLQQSPRSHILEIRLRDSCCK